MPEANVVESKTVTGRRKLQFSSYQDILDDVRLWAAQPHRKLGNWSLGQICEHLAKAMTYAVDGAPFKVAIWLRMFGRLVKNRIISRPMSPGFKLPKSAADYVPNPTADAEGIAHLERAIERYQQATALHAHVLLGPMTRAEWDQLNFRHAEMHLSFIVPK